MSAVAESWLKDKTVADEPRQGFFLSYAATAILATILFPLLGLATADHSAIGRLDDKMEFMNSRVVDGTVVARLVDHDQNIIERLKIIDERLKNLETFAGASTQDRASLHFEMNSLREYLRYMGKAPPQPSMRDDPGNERHP